MPSATFQPDWVSPPGETVGHILEERDWSFDDFSKAIEIDRANLEQLLNGTLAICDQVAEKLSQTLGATPEFWSTRESNYRASLLRLESQVQDADSVSWLRSFPFADMANHGWIRKTQKPAERLSECLRFFGVGDVDAWEEKYQKLTANVAFRTSATFDSKVPSVAAWLRKGELEASRIERREWSLCSFLASLPEIRNLTRESDPQKFIPKLIELCGASGLSVVVLPAPKGCKASGATRFVNKSHPVLMLSARHLSDDHFWFTFFHESGHLALHGHEQLFIEFDSSLNSKEEQEANSFAQDILIPTQYREEFLQLKRNTRQVARFARRIGISPGIVVGQLQHHGVFEQSRMNKIKRWFQWDGSRLVAKQRYPRNSS